MKFLFLSKEHITRLQIIFLQNMAIVRYSIVQMWSHLPLVLFTLKVAEMLKVIFNSKRFNKLHTKKCLCLISINDVGVYCQRPCTCWSKFSVRCCLALQPDIRISTQQFIVFSEMYQRANSVYLHTWWKFVTSSALTTGGCTKCVITLQLTCLSGSISPSQFINSMGSWERKNKKHQMDILDENKKKGKNTYSPLFLRLVHFT